MAKKNTKSSRTRAIAHGTRQWMSRAVHGTLVSSSFFTRHRFSILLLLSMVFLYIANKYTCQSNMGTIAALGKRLEVVKSESIRQHSTYMSRTSESAMQQMVDTLHLGLTVQERPPYRLTYSNEEI